MGRSLRPWWLAVFVSLLLHGWLIGGTQWSLPQWVSPSEPPPLDVQLTLAALPEVVPLPAPPKIRAEAVAPSPAAQDSVLSVAGVSPTPAESTVIESVAASEPVAPVAAPQPQIADSPAAPADVTALAPPPLNPLPARVDMRFKVTYGVAAGEQTLVWVNESGKHYTVISVAEATGLTGLFYRGQFVQTSRGRITPYGLQPQAFWDQRGDRRSSAKFDAELGHLTFNPHKGAPRHFSYQGDVQDVLSLFFQLALTVPSTTSELGYTVFNGKRLRDYRYEVRGETMLDTAVGPLRTLHLARLGNNDGRFEIWLAADRHYLPVRVLKSDEKNNEVELLLLSMKL